MIRCFASFDIGLSLILVLQEVVQTMSFAQFFISIYFCLIMHLISKILKLFFIFAAEEAACQAVFYLVDADLILSSPLQ